MNEKLKTIGLLLILALLIGCDKYSAVTGQSSITGNLYLKDTLSPTLPAPASNQIIYLNEGKDTASYLMQLKTDSLGQFSATNLKSGKEYTLYAKFVKDNLLYSGAVSFSASVNEKVGTQNITAYAKSTNGISLTFTDANGGPIANLPFRLYSSLVVAEQDSVRYASLSSTTDLTGQTQKFNLPAIKFYIVAAMELGGVTKKALDSVTVKPTGISKRTVVVN